MKKLSFALTALATFTAGSVMAQGVNTADGTVEIRGKVSPQTCEVAGTYKNLVVILDTVGTNRLKTKGAVAGVKPFQIKLTGCGDANLDATVNSVFASFSTASFDDVVDLDGTGVLKNKAPSGADKVGVQILNADGTAVNLNPETLLKDGTAGGVTATTGVAGPYTITDPEVTFGVLRGLKFDGNNLGTTYANAAREVAFADTPATDVLGKKVAGGETWVAGNTISNKGAKLGASDIVLEYKAQYIATDTGATAGDVEAFMSYNIAYK